METREIFRVSRIHLRIGIPIQSTGNPIKSHGPSMESSSAQRLVHRHGTQLPDCTITHKLPHEYNCPFGPVEHHPKLQAPSTGPAAQLIGLRPISNNQAIITHKSKKSMSNAIVLYRGLPRRALVECRTSGILRLLNF